MIYILHSAKKSQKTKFFPLKVDLSIKINLKQEFSLGMNTRKVNRLEVRK